MHDRRSFQRALLAWVATGLTIAAVPAPAVGGRVAQVTRAFHEIQVVTPGAASRKAVPGEFLEGSFRIEAGEDSRCELALPREGMLWIGGSTGVSVDTRKLQMRLERGAALIRFPAGGSRPIRLGDTALVGKGASAIVEYGAGAYVKVIALAGSVRFFLPEHFGHSRVLRPGEMVILEPSPRAIPESVSIDLARLVNSSALVQMAATGEATWMMSAVNRAIQRQEKQKARARAFETNLWINGRGTSVLIGRAVPEEPANSGESDAPASDEAPDSRPADTAVADLPAEPQGSSEGLDAGDGEIVQTPPDPDAFVFSLQAFRLE